MEGAGDEEILENLSSQDVTDVRRINARRNNELVLTLCTSTLSKFINAGYLNTLLSPLFQII